MAAGAARRSAGGRERRAPGEMVLVELRSLPKTSGLFIVVLLLAREFTRFFFFFFTECCCFFYVIVGIVVLVFL